MSTSRSIANPSPQMMLVDLLKRVTPAIFSDCDNGADLTCFSDQATRIVSLPEMCKNQPQVPAGSSPFQSLALN